MKVIHAMYRITWNGERKMLKRELSRKIVQYIRDEMNKLTNAELNQVISECRDLNETNCDWLEYEIKDALIENAEQYLKSREYWKKREMENEK
jgi:uncharacterized protein YpuA (DUF1002 family)